MFTFKKKKVMNPEQLQEKLNASRKYWETDGKEGEIADLRGADLRGAILRGADLRGADLRGAILTGAILTDAVLRGADLTGAILTGAILTDAVLRGAVLTDAVLTDAVLTDAVLTGAVLRGVSIGGAKGLTGESFGINPDPLLPQQVAQAIVLEQSLELEMTDWHTCETTHCLAGSAIHLSGPAGYALERATSPSIAGAMLMPSACHLFHASNEEAMEWLKAQLER